MNPEFEIRSCTSEKYRYEDLFFFYETGFFNYRATKKWVEDITISFEKGALQQDYEDLNFIIKELKPLLQPLSIQQVKKDGKIEIQIDYKRDGKEVPMQIIGHCQPTTGFSSQIKTARIWLSPSRSGVDRRNVLRHELMHALGFVHPENRKGTVIGGVRVFESLDEYENRANLYDGFTDLDIAAIKILYSECIPRNLSRNEFWRQLRKLKEEQGTEK